MLCTEEQKISGAGRGKENVELVKICIKVRSGNHLPVEPDYGIWRGTGLLLRKDHLRGGEDNGKESKKSQMV